MKAHDMLELATRNLRESKLRNALTTLGIAIGVASLVAMLALGVGLQEMASERLGRSGLFDTVVVFSRRDVISFDRSERRANPSNADSRSLDDSARAEMAKLPGVVEVYPEMRFSTEVRFGERSHFTTVAGLPLSAKENEAFDSLQGKFFSGGNAEEAILQLDFARVLNPKPAELIGQGVTLRYAERQALAGAADDLGYSVVRKEKPLKIIGIVEDEPFGGMRSFARGRVFVPVETAEAMNVMQLGIGRDTGDGSSYRSLLVRMASPATTVAVQDAIKKMGFTTWSALDATKSIRRFFVVLDLFLAIFGSLAVAVASLAIINTLVMAVLERRREIGIMKALGASDVDIKRLFFAEAGAMGVVGGVAGVLLGWAIGTAINVGTSFYMQRQELPPETVWSAPWWLVLAAIGFSVAVSLMAGIYPAARAAKLDPVQALRYE
jgi:putative ABC transport system permease protein